METFVSCFSLKSLWLVEGKDNISSCRFVRKTVMRSTVSRLTFNISTYWHSQNETARILLPLYNHHIHITSIQTIYRSTISYKHLIYFRHNPAQHIIIQFALGPSIATVSHKTVLKLLLITTSAFAAACHAVRFHTARGWRVFTTHWPSNSCTETRQNFSHSALNAVAHYSTGACFNFSYSTHIQNTTPQPHSMPSGQCTREQSHSSVDVAQSPYGLRPVLISVVYTLSNALHDGVNPVLNWSRPDTS